MASTYSNLKFELIATGEQSGQWGSTTNNNIGTAIEQAITGMATLVTGDFTSNVATLTLTNTNALQNARAVCLNITATLSAAGTLNVPAIQKPYIILNNSVGGFAVTVKVSGQTGISIPNGRKCLVYNNGTDVGDAITYLSSLTLGSALPAASGGTGLTSPGTNGNVLTSNGSAWVSSSPSTSGTVTSVAGTGSANGLSLSGTVTTSGNITLGGAVTSLTTTNFTIQESGGVLVFKYGATTIATMDSSGNLTTLANVTAYGTI
jgi:hypothetical protein